LRTGETDVPSAARRRRISLEHAARECRYEFLHSTAVSLGAQWVALGHTADDQLETVLFHLQRGAGIHGLAGMPVSRPIEPGSSVRIVRPLLGVTRGELIEHLRLSGEEYRTDHTNLDTVYTRNRIRHETVPALEASWPGVRAEVGEFARVLGELDGLLDTRAYEWLTRHAAPTGSPAVPARQAVEVRLADLATLEEPMLSYVLRRLITRTLGDLRRIDEVHVRMIAELAAGGATGSSLDLPRGLVVRRGYDRLCFGREERTVPDPAGQVVGKGGWAAPEVPTPVELETPGTTRWGAWVFTTTVLEEPDLRKELSGPPGPEAVRAPGRTDEDAPTPMRTFIDRLKKTDPSGVEYLDLDRVGGAKLTVRCRLPGDRFTPLGAPGQTKLKDFFIRRKVPRAERDHVPLIVAEGRVLLVVGLGIADGVALTDDTRRILKIRSIREDTALSRERRP
jgi:tRNA(Ile)-lysidine synthase